MCAKNLGLTKIYEGQEIAFREIGGQSEVRIDEVAKFCGWVTVATSGNECIRWNRVNEYLTDLGVSTSGHGQFIPEYIMYPLIGKANNEKATQFMLWVGKVLVEIRQHGAYIGENADVNYVNNELRFSKKRTIKTFASANVGDVKALYDEFRAYVDKEYKYKTDERLARYKSVESGMDTLHNTLAKADIGNIGDCYNIQKLKEKVIIDRTTLEKRISGGDKAGKTKKISKLEIQIANVNNMPSDGNFVWINEHGFSNNYMYDYKYGKTCKTDAYRRWVCQFPVNQLPSLEYWECDFDKPVELFINYVAIADTDIQNLDKSIIDMICHELGIDDNIVDIIHSKRVETCEDYLDGKIGIYIRNV